MTSVKATTADLPRTEDWDAWRARIDERMEHVATRADLANLRVWMFATMVTVGALTVAAMKFLLGESRASTRSGRGCADVRRTGRRRSGAAFWQPAAEVRVAPRVFRHPSDKDVSREHAGPHM